MNKETKFKVGDKAYKPKGYKFPCTVVGVFETIEGNIRVVGEMDEYGLLHIFNEDQLEPTIIEEVKKEEWAKMLDSYEKLKGEEIKSGNRDTYEGGFDSSTWLSTVG
jgi:hypothetical protein